MANSVNSLPQLTVRARRIRALYAAAARRAGTRPWGPAELALGFVGDVGDLMKLVMAKEGLRPAKAKNLDAALAHELADCLWSILLLADAYDVKLEPAFLGTMDTLASRLAPATPSRPGRRPSRTRQISKPRQTSGLG